MHGVSDTVKVGVEAVTTDRVSSSSANMEDPPNGGNLRCELSQRKKGVDQFGAPLVLLLTLTLVLPLPLPLLLRIRPPLPLYPPIPLQGMFPLAVPLPLPLLFSLVLPLLFPTPNSLNMPTVFRNLSTDATSSEAHSIKRRK